MALAESSCTAAPPPQRFVPLERHLKVRDLQFRAARRGDVGELVKSVEGTIWRVARRFGRGLLDERDLEDLVAAGKLGAVVAAGQYDPLDERGASFNTYAVRAIMTYVVGEAFFFWSKGRFKRSAATQRLFFRYGSARRSLEKMGREPTPEAVAEVLGVNAEFLKSVMDVVTSPDRSCDERIGGEGVTTFIESVPDDGAISPLEDLCSRADMSDVEQAFLDLDERSRYVLSERFYGERKLSEIAEDIQVSPERVRQIQCEALAKLRRLLDK